MEDQSTDSSDLTVDADTASVPQGKAGRSRHRLPRQKAQSVDQTEDEAPVDVVEKADETTEVESTAPESEVVEPEAVELEAVEPEVESTPVEPTPVEPEVPGKRRRLSWGRSKPADVAPEAETDDAETDPQGPEPEVVLVPHRPAGRALKYAAVVAAALFVAAGAFAGVTVQPYLADRAAVQTKFAIAETAANAITTLWTYTPEDMDKLPERSAKYLGGDFAADYRRYIDAIASSNKQAQVSNDTQVLGAAVESLTPTEATAIVYTNSVATSPVTKGIPSLRYLSYRLNMKRDESRWLITQMVAVTKLDLTPRL